MADSTAQIRTSYGGLRRPKSDAPKERLTALQKAHRSEELAKAHAQALLGDDTLYRSLIDIRFAVECVTSLGGGFGEPLPNGQYGRRRKFDRPLFLTPNGLIEAYPESDTDLFVLIEHATSAVHSFKQGGQWEIRETLLSMEMTTKPYLRWAREVKGKTYVQAHRTFEELTEIYSQGGRLALANLYTKSHVAKIIARLREDGVPMHEHDKEKAGFGVPG